MMGALLAFGYPAAASFFGGEVTAQILKHKFDILTCYSIGIIAGILSSSWIFYIVSFWIPLSFIHGLIHNVGLVIFGLVFRTFRLKNNTRKARYSVLSLFFGIFIPFLILSLFIEHSLLHGELWTRGACYGDLPFHMNLVSSFAHGCNSERKSMFDLVSPFYANEPLAYPIIPNFYSAAILKCCKTTYHWSIVCPSFFIAFSLFGILYKISIVFTKDNLAAALAPYLFIMLGGMGFLRFFDKNIRKQGYVDYVHNLGNSTSGTYFQTMLHVLLPQRASLHSLPVAWAVILLLLVSSDTVDVRLFVYAGFLVALLPQVQAHSVVSVGQWGIVYSMLRLFYKKPFNFKVTFINYGLLASVAILLGLLQIKPYLRRVGEGRMMSIRPIWKPERNKTALTFWWGGLGAFVVMSLTGISVLSRKQLVGYIPSLFVFFTTNFVMYQSWNLDNTKVFNAGWMPLALPVVANFISFVWKKFPGIGKIIAIMLMVFSCASGSLALRMAIREKYPLFDYNQKPFELANWAKENTDKRSVFITDTHHNHPITTLAGRQTYLGYGGWISSHSLDFHSRNTLIKQLAANPDNLKLIKKIGVDYICVHDRPSSNQISFSTKSPNWKQVYDGKFIVYKFVGNFTSIE